jgi:hypothetical protein
MRLPRKRRVDLINNYIFDPDTGCWNWTGNLYPSGYGRMRFYGVAMCVHRIAAHLFLGLPRGSKLFVLHHCDNRKCFNPKHLFLGTQKLNIEDMVAKGRHGNTQKVFCKRGHALAGANIRIYGGGRRCYVCERLRDSSHRSKHAQNLLNSEADNGHS